MKPSVTRLKRARGQLDAVIRMLEEGDECEQAVTQLSAAAKAIDRAAYAIIATGMRQCYETAHSTRLSWRNCSCRLLEGQSVSWLGIYSSGVKMSSMVQPKWRAILKASGSDGSYFPFSMLTTVCRETPRASENLC